MARPAIVVPNYIVNSLIAWRGGAEHCARNSYDERSLIKRSARGNFLVFPWRTGREQKKTVKMTGGPSRTTS